MISAVARSMAILEALSDANRGMTVSELVAALEIEKSAVSRVLASLEAGGYVVRNSPTDRFSIGLRFAALAIRRLDDVGLYDLSIPLLRQLSDKTGELAQLAIADSDGMTYVAKAEGNQHVRVLSRVGRRAILQASAAGKVWLASLPEEEALKLVLNVGLHKQTARTIGSIDELRCELQKVREQGYATVVDELVEGASAIAVPVRLGRQPQVIGAVVVSGPSYRLSAAQMKQFLPDLKGIARSVTEIGPLIRWWAESGLSDVEIETAEVEPSGAPNGALPRLRDNRTGDPDSLPVQQAPATAGRKRRPHSYR